MAPQGPIGPLGATPWTRTRLQGLDTRLPPTVLRTAQRTPPIAKPDTVACAYNWHPTQVKTHAPATLHHVQNLGTYVNTLTMDFVSSDFLSGSTAKLIRLESTSFRSKGSLWCYLVGGSFVICKGVIAGLDLAPSQVHRVGRLPAGHRPRNNLKFAALSREPFDVGGHVSYSNCLVIITVDSDGWIDLHAGREPVGHIDMGAVRFCTVGGISLIDQVSLHTVDVCGTRLVCLQGTLQERYFTVHSHKPLALLPESCRPPKDLPFITPGVSKGGFNLLMAKPSYGMGCGGDLYWRDAIWNHDCIHLTGMMYEVSADAVAISTLSSRWTEESLQVFVKDFQNFLIRRFGSIESAWSQAFDTDGSGSVNFTEFGLGCKAAGYVGNTTRLWAALDADSSGEIALVELNLGVTGSPLAMCFERVSTLDILQMSETSSSPPSPQGDQRASRTWVPGMVVESES